MTTNDSVIERCEIHPAWHRSHQQKKRPRCENSALAYPQSLDARPARGGFRDDQRQIESSTDDTADSGPAILPLRLLDQRSRSDGDDEMLLYPPHSSRPHPPRAHALQHDLTSASYHQRFRAHQSAVLSLSDSMKETLGNKPSKKHRKLLKLVEKVTSTLAALDTAAQQPSHPYGIPSPISLPRLDIIDQQDVQHSAMPLLPFDPGPEEPTPSQSGSGRSVILPPELQRYYDAAGWVGILQERLVDLQYDHYEAIDRKRIDLDS